MMSTKENKEKHQVVPDPLYGGDYLLPHAKMKVMGEKLDSSLLNFIYLRNINRLWNCMKHKKGKLICSEILFKKVLLLITVLIYQVMNFKRW